MNINKDEFYKEIERVLDSYENSVGEDTKHEMYNLLKQLQINWEEVTSTKEGD